MINRISLIYGIYSVNVSTILEEEDSEYLCIYPCHFAFQNYVIVLFSEISRVKKFCLDILIVWVLKFLIPLFRV